MSLLVFFSGSAGATTHDTTGALAGAGSTLAGTAARSGASVTHDTSGALVGQGSALAGTAERIRIHATSGALVGPGSTIDGSASTPVKAATVTGGGIGHGGKKKKPTAPQIAVITVDGQDYRVPVRDMPAFLAKIRERVTQPDAVLLKVAKRPAKAAVNQVAPPEIVIKSAPVEFMPEIASNIERSNEILAQMWAGMIANYLREMDEEDSIILLCC